MRENEAKMWFGQTGWALAIVIVLNLAPTVWWGCAGDASFAGQMICCETDEQSCQGATETTTQWNRHPDKQRVAAPNEGSLPPEVSSLDPAPAPAGGPLSFDWASPIFSRRHHSHAPPYLVNQVFRI